MFQHDVTELFAFCFQFVYLPFLFCDKHTEVHESPLWQPSSLNAKKRHGVQRPSWCIWSMAKRGTGTARGTGATPVKFSVSGMVIPATDDPQLIPSGTWSSRDGFFFSDWRMGNPKNPTVLFVLSQNNFVGRRANEGQVFLLVMPQWWCFFCENMSNGFLKSRSRIFWEILKHLAIQCRLEPLSKTGIFEMIPPDGLRISSKTDGESLSKSTSENCFHEGGHGELKCFMPSLTM